MAISNLTFPNSFITAKIGFVLFCFCTKQNTKKVTNKQRFNLLCYARWEYIWLVKEPLPYTFEFCY